ncbi:OLC1v1010856C1 [Oldenlandia corymbosa var. corymbosa]|uniref:OLC1v1010856C1 n=1 Tax=Oldenlandia corymbosa var. corymbosa TaxID=529605 RepID=A0AAV1DU09_OLDCO|nr:OLC1v1010856C1 [Oldenlandia corymbosa var. corymbosa]
MGEQTQSQSPSPSSQFISDSSPVPLPPSPSSVTGSSLDANVLQKSTNPSKIPIRPQKIRKLSTNPTSTVTTDSVVPAPAVSDPNSQQINGSSSSSPTLPIPASVSPATTTTTSIVNSTSGGSANKNNRRRSAIQAARVVPRIIKPLSADGEIDAAIHHLRMADPLLGALIETCPPPALESHHSPFLSLAKSILYQQLAYKAGTSIYNRFVALCGGEAAVIPDNVLALSAQQLKQVGISGRKASYLYDLANKYKSGILSDETVVKMDDRSLFTMLSMVKGIGSWSVHMFMIFSLHRPDVLPVSDLGVRKGVQLLYGLDDLPRPSQMEQLCEKWKPYRSVGAWYMWRFVEGKGSQNLGAAPTIDATNVQPLQQVEPQPDEQQQHQLQLLEPINGMGNLGNFFTCS